MLKCKYVSKQLSLYFDNELDAALSEQITQHIDACPSCRQELNAIKAVSSMFKEQEVLPVTDEFKNKLHMNLVNVSIEKSPPAWFMKPVWRTSFAAAVMCVLLVVVLSSIVNAPGVKIPHTIGFDTADESQINNSSAIQNIKPSDSMKGLGREDESSYAPPSLAVTEIQEQVSDSIMSGEYDMAAVESNSILPAPGESSVLPAPPKEHTESSSGGSGAPTALEPDYESAPQCTISFTAKSEVDLQTAYDVVAVYCNLSATSTGYEGTVDGELVPDLIKELEAVDGSALNVEIDTTYEFVYIYLIL